MDEEPKMNEEIEKLQGTWNVVALEVEGRKMPLDVFTGSKIEVKGEHFTALSMGATYSGTLTVDAAHNPKTFDLKFSEGPEKDSISYGIYQLDGDLWQVCLTISGDSRPKTFATSPGSGHALETLKRDRTPVH